jgi:hypothetical protein
MIAGCRASRDDVLESGANPQLSEWPAHYICSITNEVDPFLQWARSKIMKSKLPSGLKLFTWSSVAFVAAIGTMFLGYGLVFSS